MSMHIYVYTHTDIWKIQYFIYKKSLKKYLLNFGTTLKFGQHFTGYFHFFHIRKEKLKDLKNIYIIHLHHLVK